MATMRVAQVSRPNGPFELVERPIPEPGAGAVRIKVEAYGICHSVQYVRPAEFIDDARDNHGADKSGVVRG
jgi:D-arabinose 1-dehydrogenase-like Zn-dependent alcohol dehydrogenase